MSVCVCVCVCARARACACVCVCARAHVQAIVLLAIADDGQTSKQQNNKHGWQWQMCQVCNGWGWNQRWCGWNISKTEAGAPKGRYIVFTPYNPVSYFEMVVYGKSQAPPPPPPPPLPPRPAPLMGPFIGVNSFVTEPLLRQNAAGWIREYHDWYVAFWVDLRHLYTCLGVLNASRQLRTVPIVCISLSPS